MSVGFKIKQLRERSHWSQPELADKLGISTGALSNIGNDKTQKIDFQLMDKVCKTLGVDFGYFIKPAKSNVVETNVGGVVGCNKGTINNFPENILEQIQLLIQDNKEKELKILELESKLRG
ncbi:helix-turn-helix domain-containing protein [Flavobacterium sp.]|uniref:helix-turn-helix domain-containing protein n=1 Tax=Flavobacterium sp. TaxID=239 RepID=UPI003D0E6559